MTTTDDRRAELVALFDEIGHAIASAEAEFHYAKLDREADGAHRALTEVSKIRSRALAATAEQEASRAV